VTYTMHIKDVEACELPQTPHYSTSQAIQTYAISVLHVQIQYLFYIN
jgi:hypothetical protein